MASTTAAAAPAEDCDLGACVARLLQDNCDLNQLPGSLLHGKHILYRADLNLPLSKDHKSVTDATRLDSIMPTLRLLLSKGACVVLCSHLGRPNASKQTLQDMQQQFSLAPVAHLLEERLGAASFTGLAPDCVGIEAAAAVSALKPGQVRCNVSVLAGVMWLCC